MRLSQAVTCGLVQARDVLSIIKMKLKMIALMSVSQVMADVEYVESRAPSSHAKDLKRVANLRKNVEHYLLTIVDVYVLRMQLTLNLSNVTSDAFHLKYMEVARKVRVLENWSTPMYTSEMNLSTEGLMTWNDQLSRYEISNRVALEVERSRDIDSFNMGLLKVDF